MIDWWLLKDPHTNIALKVQIDLGWPQRKNLYVLARIVSKLLSLGHGCLWTNIFAIAQILQDTQQWLRCCRRCIGITFTSSRSSKVKDQTEFWILVVNFQLVSRSSYRSNLRHEGIYRPLQLPVTSSRSMVWLLCDWGLLITKCNINTDSAGTSRFSNLQEHFSDYNIICVTKHSAENDDHTVCLRFNVPNQIRQTGVN